MGRQWRDHYTRRARREGYGARSVFKLAEVQRRTRIVPKGGRALDLGCAPGSWTRYMQEQGVREVVGVDVQEPEGYTGRFLQGDVHRLSPQAVIDLLGGPADLVVSDMAPATTGNRLADHVRQIALARRALDFVDALLVEGGGFVAKVFDGEDAQDFVEAVRERFSEVRRIRPAATRKRSRELFVVATGHRGVRFPQRPEKGR